MEPGQVWTACRPEERQTWEGYTEGTQGRAEWEEVWEDRETRRKVLTSTDFTQATQGRQPSRGPHS